jgi:hypothetical protein
MWRVPQTPGLQNQKKQSLPTDLQWWLDVLHRGYVYKSKYGLEKEYFGGWHEWVSTDVLFMSYSEFAKSKNERHQRGRPEFGKFMTDMGCRPTRPRGEQVVGEHQHRSPMDGVLMFELVKNDRPPGYHIGTLEEARKAFEGHTKMEFTWDAADESLAGEGSGDDSVQF